jgi:o-succinylbenzoate synthase
MVAVKLAEIHLHRYDLPLTRALTANSNEVTRSGLILEVKNDSGSAGFGECAPLPGFSKETIDDATEQLKRLCFALVGANAPGNLDELSGGFENWLGEHGLSPSARFAVESAVLSLAAVNANTSLSALLSSDSAASLPVNALLRGDRDFVIKQAKRSLADGFKTFKLKVGHGDLRDDIGLTASVREIIGENCGLRLDANRQWDVRQAIDFWNAVDTLGIEYIEEPVADHAALVKDLTKVGLPALVSMMLPPTALDESIVDLDPDTFVPPPGVKAIILKPTLLGLERAMRWARKAIRAGLTPVVTSSYETSVGLSTLARFGASLSPEPAAMGLATIDVFERDLLKPSVAIENACIDLTALPDMNSAIQRDVLTLVDSYG